MRKKLPVLLLSLVLCVSLLPIGAMAYVTEYGVFVGNTQVTSDNAADVLGNGNVSYDAGSNTLKLNGAVVGSIIFNEVSKMCIRDRGMTSGMHTKPMGMSRLST